MTGDITPYLNLVPSQHAAQPNFIAELTFNLQPYADALATLQSMQTLFDVDTAIGDQLVAIGNWVGVGPNVSEPLTGVYFSLDEYPGLDQGSLKGPYDPATGLVQLPDAQYRTLLRARIAANHWDGRNVTAQSIISTIIPTGTVFVQDNQDMSMFIGYVGPPLDALTYALLIGGYLNVDPAAVEIRGYATSSVQGDPIFGLDANNGIIGGLDDGALAILAGGN